MDEHGDAGKGRAFPSSAIDPAFGGMTLRDWFAGQALGGIMHLCAKDTFRPDETIDQLFARKAYEIADALLAQREKP